MILLDRKDYPDALALFGHSSHMRLMALAEGRIEARVWADAPKPRVAFVLYKNKLHVASTLPADELADALRPFLLEKAYGDRMGCGAGEAQVFWEGENTREALDAALWDKCPAELQREYYELRDPAACRQAPRLAGYEIRNVDAALLQENLGGTELLMEEMCSERVSVEAFLEGSFGVAAVCDGRLAGWCLSEYNCTEGCEVGIEVAEGHRRRGLAASMVSALASEAALRSVPKIGWHCFRNNIASSATALSAGFKKAGEYGELLCFFEPAVQYAVNGNFSDGAGRYEEALGWYERAVAAPDAPLWAYVRLAMAATSLGRFGRAYASLETAKSRGFEGWGWLRAEPRLEPLRGVERWKQLF